MVEWKFLNDICGIYDGTHQTPKYTDSGVKFVSVENIGAPYSSQKYISEEDYSKNYKTKPQKGDVLMTRIGDVGTCAVLNSDEPIAYYVSLALLRPNVQLVQSNYVKYILESNIGKRELRKKTLLTAVPLKINLGDVGKLKLPIPSISEQERIVGILDTFTSSIDNLKQQIAQRRKQYEYYRDQLLDFKDNDIIEKLSFGGDFMLKARIGWQGLTKKEYRDSGEYKLITGTDFTKYNRIDFDNCVYVDKDRYDQDPYIQIHEDDVLITKDGTLGKIAYIDKMNMPATLNGGVFVVRDKSSRVLQKFMMYYLTSSYFVNWMKQNHTQGSIQHLTQALLSKFSIPVVSKEKQMHIIGILDSFTDSIQNLEAQLSQREKQYEYYRNKLLTFD